MEATDSFVHAQNGKVKTAILAGSGRLPELAAMELRRTGHEPLIVSIDGEAGPWIGRFDHIGVKSIAVGVLVRSLKAKAVRRVALCGGIRARPSLWSIRCDWVTLSNLHRFFFALRRGDDALLRGVIALLEEQGFMVIGAHEILPELLAPIGVLTKRRPTANEQQDCKMAFEAAIHNGRNDFGQAAVAIAGAIVAVEDFKGTNAMIAQVEELRRHSVTAAGGVLAKAAKPQQEHRADLPTIGPDTVSRVIQAGLAGIIVSAGSSLILDREEVIMQADAAGIFVEGRDADAPG